MSKKKVAQEKHRLQWRACQIKGRQLLSTSIIFSVSIIMPHFFLLFVYDGGEEFVRSGLITMKENIWDELRSLSRYLANQQLIFVPIPDKRLPPNTIYLWHFSMVPNGQSINRSAIFNRLKTELLFEADVANESNKRRKELLETALKNGEDVDFQEVMNKIEIVIETEFPFIKEQNQYYRRYKAETNDA